MIKTGVDGDVTVLEIARHERRNALDLEHCQQLHQAIGAATGRAIVITGEGSSFCAGADLTGVYGPDFRQALYDMLQSVAAQPVPVIASINGPAIGAGTQLALACDLRVAVPEARFAVPTARNGLAVDSWTIARLQLLAGGGTARGILIGCDSYDASFALQRGLVDRIGDHAAALAWAHELAELAPLTHAYNKLALNNGPDVEAAFEACWSSQDQAEAELARREKRKPRFSGS